MHAGLAALAVTAGLLFSGCSAPPPPIAAELAQDLQSEVQGIAFLTARGDTADAVAAAHALAARVRTAQTEGQITDERAVMILQRIEQLIERLVRSGAAPAPADVPQPFAGPAVPEAPPSPKPEPTETDEPDDPAPSETPDPAETPEPVVPEPAEALEDSSGSGSSGSSGSDSGSSGSSGSDSGSSGSFGSDSGPVVPIPVIIDEVNDDDDDDDGGKGRGRGRSSDD